MFINNQCKICKRSRIEKPTKTPPRKLLTNDAQNQKDYQFISNNIQSKEDSNKNKLIKSNSKEKLSPSKERKSNDKKNEIQDSRMKGFVNENKSKGVLIQGYNNNIQKERVSSNVKSNLNLNENNFKKGQFISSNYTNLAQKQPITNNRISDLSKAPNFARITKSNVSENVFSSNKAQNFK